MTTFQEAILKVVRFVPAGKVVSYGQVAAYLGAPRAARQVGWAMRSLDGAPDFPWWRVLNNAGLITIKGNKFSSAQMQKELLESEGIIVDEHYKLDMAEYRFRPSLHDLEKLHITPDQVDRVLSKYDID